MPNSTKTHDTAQQCEHVRAMEALIGRTRDTFLRGTTTAALKAKAYRAEELKRQCRAECGDRSPYPMGSIGPIAFVEDETAAVFNPARPDDTPPRPITRLADRKELP